MDPIGLLDLAVLIVVVYVAFRVGAVLMKTLLGLVAIRRGVRAGRFPRSAGQDIRLPQVVGAPGTLTCEFS